MLIPDNKANKTAGTWHLHIDKDHKRLVIKFEDEISCKVHNQFLGNASFTKQVKNEMMCTETNSHRIFRNYIIVKD